MKASVVRLFPAPHLLIEAETSEDRNVLRLFANWQHVRPRAEFSVLGFTVGDGGYESVGVGFMEPKP